MGRLLPGSLYSAEYDSCKDDDGLAIHEWEKAADNIRILDPNGERSLALLRQMELEMRIREFAQVGNV